VSVSKSRERHFFGQSFTFERPCDDDRAYFLDVARCLWQSFFVAEGAPELTPLFCEFDANWIDAIDPDRHGVRFSRPTTLGHGGPLCPFHFYRVAPATAATARRWRASRPVPFPLLLRRPCDGWRRGYDHRDERRCGHGQ